jgi:hypothetical protein
VNLAEIIEADLRNAKDRASIDSIGQDAAQDEEKGRWRLAALVNLLDRAYGKAAIVDFARVVNRKRSYIYEAGQVYGFYGPAQVFELVEPNEDGNRVITFSHMRDAMRAYRKLHPEDSDLARDEALQWLDVVAGDLMTVEQASLKLKERLGIVSTPPIRFTARVVTVGTCSLLLAVSDTTVFAEGAVYKFSATVTVNQGDE